MSIDRTAGAWIVAMTLVSANASAFQTVPDAACCIPDGMGTCLQLPERKCVAAGGIWQGPGSLCPDTPQAISQNVPISIPDNDPNGVSSTIMGLPFEIVTSVSVQLVVTHTFVGDLCITLEHDGRIVPLIRRPGANGACFQGEPFGCNSDNYDIELRDDAAVNIEDVCGPADMSLTPPGIYSAAYSLDENFGGTFADGPWTLTISDNAGGDIGTLESWSVSCGLTCPCCCGFAGPWPHPGCEPNAAKACCLPDGLCTNDGTEMDCMMMGGHVINHGPFPLCLQCVSCELGDECCYFDDEEDCIVAGGTPKVSYTNLQNYGACCFDGDDQACCRRLGMNECVSEGGTFLGLGTTCFECPIQACLDADLNGSCEVEFQDLLTLLAAWSPGAASCPMCAADLDGDDDVDFQDLLILLAEWGPCL